MVVEVHPPEDAANLLRRVKCLLRRGGLIVVNTVVGMPEGDRLAGQAGMPGIESAVQFPSLLSGFVEAGLVDTGDWGMDTNSMMVGLGPRTPVLCLANFITSALNWKIIYTKR